MQRNWNSLSLEKWHSLKMDFHWGMILSGKEWPSGMWLEKCSNPGNHSADEKNGSTQGIKDLKEFKDNQLQIK